MTNANDEKAGGPLTRGWRYLYFRLLLIRLQAGQAATALREVFWFVLLLAVGTAVVERWGDGIALAGESIPTVLQVVVAVQFALYVLIVSSVMVIAQQASTMYSGRAAMVIGTDQSVQRSAGRLIVLTVATLGMCVALREADNSWVQAAGTVLVVATALVLLGAARLVPTLVRAYLSPRTFSLMVGWPVAHALRKGNLGEVVYRLPLLGEMLVGGIRRGDGTAASAALEAMESFYTQYLEAADADENVRMHKSDDGQHAHEGWAADYIGRYCFKAIEAGFGVSSNEVDMDLANAVMERCAIASIKAGRNKEARYFIEWLTRAGTILPPNAASGPFRVAWTNAIPSVANIEAAAEEAGVSCVSAYALASWATQLDWLGTMTECWPSDVFLRSLARLGPDPRWPEAAITVLGEEWTLKWANRLRTAPEGIIAVAKAVREDLGEEEIAEVMPPYGAAEPDA